jgi:hypothetical protein
VTNVTNGTYPVYGTPTTTALTMGIPHAVAPTVAGAQTFSCLTGYIGSGFRIRAFPIATPANLQNRLEILDVTPAAAIVRSNTVTFNTGAYGNTGVGVASSNIIYGRQYINAYSSVDQTNPVANAENLMIFGTTDISNGISIVTNGTALTRITFANGGLYNLQFSAQLSQTSGGASNTYIWLKKNGATVANTAGDTQVAGNGDKIMAAWNYVFNAAAGDYYELAWAATDTSTILDAIAAAGVVPAIPSVILTVVPVGA